MRPIQLDEATYRDKVYACWMGKNIGGTLGAPWEGDKNAHNLTFYDPVPSEAEPNDDLDFQLVWLKMLQERGIYPCVGDFADYWQKHLGPYPWDEYGYCQRNLALGLRPPISGCFQNCFIDNMGAPIRSEIWACVAPGDPALAASLAWQDAALDHAGGEGLYGEMFWSALQSAAFFISDPSKLIQIGLAMIPVHSRIAHAINHAVWCHANDLEGAEARQEIVNWFGHNHPCHALQNHAFTIIGWLYGDDFGDRLCAAVNCGYDTDCTGATLGATLGIIDGSGSIPEKWRGPIGEDIILHKFTHNLDAPETISELTDQTVAVGKELVAARSTVAEVSQKTTVPEDAISCFSDNTQALAALQQDPQSAIERVGDYDVALHYGGEPVMRTGIERTVGVSVRHNLAPVAAQVELEVPRGWTVQPAEHAFGQKRFTIRADQLSDDNYVKVTAKVPEDKLDAEYLFLAPEEQAGYPCGVLVERCPDCGARIECCVCPQQRAGESK